MKIFFLLLILIPIFEIVIFAILLNFIGFLYSVTEIFITFIIGFYLFSKNKESALGFKNNTHSLKNFNKILFGNNKFSPFIFIGSIFLIIPGYISDVIGILLMLKPIQMFIIKYLMTFFKLSSVKNNYNNNESTEIIDGEFYDLHNDESDISKK